MKKSFLTQCSFTQLIYAIFMNPSGLGAISKNVGQKEPKSSMHFTLIKTLSISSCKSEY